jgi:chorismate mutase
VPETLTAIPADTSVVPTVTAGRAEIDAIDAEIRALVARRVEVSRQIQARRAVEGLRGNQHVREVEVIRGYSEALGRPGAAIALELLTLCRG